ncbi:MAG: MBL fold metallo-hydrolase, partial [Clostridium sp.]|nr:MBL fold metallo-hydrolase [Clostridium sp.]
MIFCSLYSGSSGNSIFISSEKSKILVDAGLSGKSIELALSRIK